MSDDTDSCSSWKTTDSLPSLTKCINELKMKSDKVPPPPPSTAMTVEVGSVESVRPSLKMKGVKKIKKESPDHIPDSLECSQDVLTSKKRHIRMLRNSKVRGIIFESEDVTNTKYINKKLYIKHTLLVPMQPPARSSNRKRSRTSSSSSVSSTKATYRRYRMGQW